MHPLRFGPWIMGMSRGRVNIHRFQDFSLTDDFFHWGASQGFQNTFGWFSVARSLYLSLKLSFSSCTGHRLFLAFATLLPYLRIAWKYFLVWLLLNLVLITFTPPLLSYPVLHNKIYIVRNQLGITQETFLTPPHRLIPILGQGYAFERSFISLVCTP